MPDFAFDDDERDEWAKDGSAALLLAALAVRKRMLAAVGAGLPSDPAKVFHADWWENELDGPVADVYQRIAGDAAERFHEGVGLGTIPDQLRDAIASAVAATIIVGMGGRSEVVAQRVDDLIAQGADAGWDGKRFTSELGLDGTGGPLSDKLIGDYGASATTGLIHGAAEGVVTEYDLEVERVWNCSFVPASRDTHMEADGQVAAPGEPFSIGGFPAMYPGDDQLPVEESVNCLCWLSYDVSKPAETVPSGDVDQALVASSAVARTVAFAVETESPYSDGVCITVEPTPAERAMLAVDGGLPAGELHVTLAYLGTTAELDENARLDISGVLSTVAAQTSPFEGEVTGIGWFDAPDTVTVGLIDAEGLAALRTNIVSALTDVGVVVATDHDFIPHMTAGYGQFDVESWAKTPLHFNELRLRYGTDILVFDLLGPAQEPPATEPVVDEIPPVEAEPMPTDTATVAFEDMPMPDAPVDDAPVDDMQGEGPGELGSVPDDILALELANRAAERAIAEAAATGVELSDDEIAAAHQAAEAEAAEMIDELVDAAGGPLGADDDAEPVGDMPDAEPSTPFQTRRRRNRPQTPSLFATEDPVVPAGLDADAVATVDKGTPYAVDGVPPAPEDVQYDWEGILIVEGIASGDGRMIGEGALTWRNLPIPLTFLDKITERHQEGAFAGWIHEIERRQNAIWGRGTLEDNDAGNKLRAILTNPNGAGRFGVSADVDLVDVVYSDPNGSVLDPMEAEDAYYAGEDVVELMTEGRLIGATGCVHPAFQEANVWLIGSGMEAVAASAGGRMWRTYRGDAIQAYGADTSALVASAAGPDPDAPPKAWFDLRPMEKPEPFTIFPDGRCYGLVAEWGDCHIGFNDRCVRVPRSNDFSHFYASGEATDAWRTYYNGPGLSRFYAGGKYVLTQEGDMVQVGPVILDNVHPSLARQASDAQAFYAHTGSAVADVRLYTNEHGIVAAGSVRPDVSAVDVRKLRASDVSPDWRWIDGELKLLAVLAVNVSGFQVEGIAASAGRFQPWAMVDASDNVTALVAAGAVRHTRKPSAEMAVLRAEIDEMRSTLSAMAATISQLQTTPKPVDTRSTERALTLLGIQSPKERAKATAEQLASLGVIVETCGCAS